VVAATALGDIVEYRRDVQQPVALEAGDQPAAQRILVRELEHGEAAQVAHHGEDVLVDRVDVEEVVLHLATMRRNAGRYLRESVLVHAPQLVNDAARLLQQREERRRLRGSRGRPRRCARARATARAASWPSCP